MFIFPVLQILHHITSLKKIPRQTKKRDNDTKYSKNQAIGLVLEQLLKAVF